mmetsp:Transcript_24016/g.49586  ORF Transcript_24016/g.49586 Transcript_24016/m.49586 type:complete len:187 (-) Transcript_24016:136-696(-)
MMSVQPSHNPTPQPINIPNNTSSITDTDDTEDGVLIVATLLATLFLSIIVHVVYYYSSRTRQIRIFTSAQAHSQEITRNSFEMIDVAGASTGSPKQHEHNESSINRSVMDIRGEGRRGGIRSTSNTTKRLEDDGSVVSIRSMRSSRSGRSRKSRRGLGRKSRKRAAVDDSSLLCANEASPDEGTLA